MVNNRTPFTDKRNLCSSTIRTPTAMVTIQRSKIHTAPKFEKWNSYL